VISATHRDAVAVAPLRDYYLRGVERGEFTAVDIAQRLGWVSRNGYGDSTRVQRALGVMPESNGRSRQPRFREHMRYDMAAKLCRALGMDPVDVGI
jgi:hypothetical protein